MEHKTTRQHNANGLAKESQTNQVKKDKKKQHTCEDCGRPRRWREKSWEVGELPVAVVVPVPEQEGEKRGDGGGGGGGGGDNGDEEEDGRADISC